MKNKSLIIGLIFVAIVAGVIYVAMQKKESTKTFAIPELGISMPIADELRDLVYAAKENEAGGVYGLSSFSLIELSQSSGSGDCRPELGALGTLVLSEAGFYPDRNLALDLGNGKSLIWDPPYGYGRERCETTEALKSLRNAQLESVREVVSRAYLTE